MIDADDYTSILVPIAIDASDIFAMTANGVAVPEDSANAWSSVTTYGVGDMVHSPTTHRVYESLKAGNTNKDPTKITNQFTSAGLPNWWLDAGPTNKFAMFDGMIATATAGASPLAVTLRPGAYNGVALFGLDGDTISIESKSAPGGTTTYTTGGDIPLEGSMPADYYEYFFAPFKPLTQFTVTNIEPYSAAELTITIKKGTGDAQIGMVAIGDVKPIGAPERDTTVAPSTYSYVAFDGYGRVTIKRRPSFTTVNIPVKMEMEDADDVLQTVQSLLDVPVAVIGSNAQYHSKMSTFGLISGSLSYAEFPYRVLNLTVKGFI